VGGDEGVVAVEEIDPDAPPGPPGESPDHLFRVSAVRPGTTVLRFEQRRPWETTAAHDTKTFEVAVSP